MRVLEKGPGWNIEVKCTGAGNSGIGCGAKLLVERDDIYLTHSYDMVGDCTTYNTIRCPICGVETDIDKKRIPNSYESTDSLKRLILGM